MIVSRVTLGFYWPAPRIFPETKRFSENNARVFKIERESDLGGNEDDEDGIRVIEIMKSNIHD